MCLSSREDKLVFDRYMKSFGFPVAITSGTIDLGVGNSITDNITSGGIG